MTDALDDSFGTGQPGSTTPSVLGDDTLNGNPVTAANVTLTPGTSPASGLLMNADGTISIAADTVPGRYAYPYTICSVADPTVCDTALASVVVDAVLDAVDDAFGVRTPGTTTESVLGNDTLNRNGATATTIALTPGTSPAPGLTMNADGTIAISATTPPGTYSYPYTICPLPMPTLKASSLREGAVDPTCDIATATIIVKAVITAAANTFSVQTTGTTTESVLSGDVMNGVPATLETVTLTPGTSPHAGMLNGGRRHGQDRRRKSRRHLRLPVHHLLKDRPDSLLAKRRPYHRGAGCPASASYRHRRHAAERDRSGHCCDRHCHGRPPPQTPPNRLTRKGRGASVARSAPP